MSGHTIAVTGANRGIGLELARMFHGRGDHVYALCRHGNEALSELGVDVIDGVDVTDPGSIRAGVSRIGAERIDVLVNVAGILGSESFDELDESDALERIRRQFEVNALGPLHVTRAFSERLGEGSKVVLITSRMGSIGDNDSGGSYGYRMSKAALNAAGKSLSLDLSERGIAVGILHPGFVRTDMTRHQGNVEPAEAASMLAQRIDELNASNSGTFFHAIGEELPW